MKIHIIIMIVICLIFSYASAQGCSNNVCDLGDYFSETNDYRCYDVMGGSAVCTCPDTTVPLTCSSTTTITTPSTPSPCLNGGTYDGSICHCPLGTWGDYCELNGTLGFCSARHCSNGGFCRENIINTTVFVYCQCQPGYRGTKCETNYFTCYTVGNFSDTDMHEQGKYFECKMISGLLRIERKSCPKGLRFDEASNVCR
ncbi:unnamed protein product [Adineta steineri]|uniref:EGF-like domain-containing protein n=1 Tax=Adineta steineri TaxID=433720 RepID=A0A819CWH0_9BILA|nr:unnamed protein product [Adineta steineri]CAF3827953.1 unnamed protein product [Adineta steineri]